MHGLTLSLSFYLVALLLGPSTAAAFLLPVGDTQCAAEICGEPEYPNPQAILSGSLQPNTPTASRRLTNARRLALGLPLNPPTRRADGDISPQVSPTPQVTYEGIIEVRFLSNGSFMGYISTRQRANGVFKYSTVEADAVVVNFSLDVGATSGSDINLEMTNSYGPLLGLVQGRENDGSDIGPNTLNYMYFNGIDLPGSLPGSVPEEIPNTYTLRTGEPRTAESSIWTVDLTTGQLSVVWTCAQMIILAIQLEYEI